MAIDFSTQNIQKFYTSARNRDFSRDFLFRVVDMQLQGTNAFNPEELVYVKAASLPGRNITNIPVPYMGLNFNVPGNTTYPGSDGYALDFYLDQYSTLREKFEATSRALFDDEISTGNYGTPGLEYYIKLDQLDKNFDTVSSYTLVGASIRNINAIDYQIAAGTGNIVSVSTTIAYHYYTTSAGTVGGI